jgi:glycosyltransferase involved in cell wall biosynthesis
MRIMFVQYTSEWTGPSKSLLLLARALRAEHSLLAVLPGMGELSYRLTDEGVDVTSLPTVTKWQLPRLVRLIRRKRVDVVYANDTNSASRVGAVAAGLAGARYVCHVRSMGWGKSWWRLGYLRSASAVIAVSSACGESVRRFVRPGRLHVVYNGVGLEELCEPTTGDREYLREVLGLPGHARVVLSIAHLCARKGQQYALEAFIDISTQEPTAHLCLVGSQEREPEYFERLQYRALDAGLGGRVHFMGYRADAPRLLPGADLFLHTAVADPHPRAVLEAMAAARPVVAFDVDGVSETVVDGETGRLVEARNVRDLAAALTKFLNSREQAEAMGEAGRRRIEAAFTERAAAEGVLRVLDSLEVGSASLRETEKEAVGS